MKTRRVDDASNITGKVVDTTQSGITKCVHNAELVLRLFRQVLHLSAFAQAKVRCFRACVAFSCAATLNSLCLKQ